MIVELPVLTTVMPTGASFWRFEIELQLFGAASITRAASFVLSDGEQRRGYDGPVTLITLNSPLNTTAKIAASYETVRTMLGATVYNVPEQ